MNRFFMGVSKLVEGECHMAMIVGNIDISRIMVYSQ